MPALHVTRRRALVAGAAFALLRPAGATPVPSEVAAELPAARLQGSGQLRFLGLQVYEARLWVGERPVSDDWTVPLALEVEYRRTFEGARIAQRALDEMRRQGEIGSALAERWLRAMIELFPDVRERDRLTGITLPGPAARFFHNGRLRGEVRDGEFARRFFGIWLAPQTSEPTLRQALIAGGRA